MVVGDFGPLGDIQLARGPCGKGLIEPVREGGKLSERDPHEEVITCIRLILEYNYLIICQTFTNKH